MLPVKKILCPTDFSQPANEGLKTANELALHFSAQLMVLHVVSTTPVVPASPTLTGFHELSALEEMEKAAKEIIATDANRYVDEKVEARLMVINGNAADEIARVAEEEKVDLIVIATHGHGGWREFFFGSVTDKVAKLSNCPVLLIHGPDEEE
jgi:nucleotide-binding universal stress UspA family protein